MCKGGQFLRFPPQQTERGTAFSIGVRHCIHFFIMAEQPRQERETDVHVQLVCVLIGVLTITGHHVQARLE